MQQYRAVLIQAVIAHKATDGALIHMDVVNGIA
jgi:hypothetical protein